MNYVAYYRVSTKKQGASGVGLDAQKNTVREHLKSGDAILKHFQDVESGKNDSRSGLHDAMKYCKEHNATLLIAKLDRLSRKASFIWDIYDSGLPFEVCDLPELNPLTIGVFAAFAQHEREIISKRTKEAMKAWRVRIKNLKEEVLKELEDGHKHLAEEVARAVNLVLKADRAERDDEFFFHTDEEVQRVIARVYLKDFKNAPKHYVLKAEGAKLNVKGSEVILKYQPSETARVQALKVRLENARNNANNVRATALIRALASQGMSANAIAQSLNEGGFKTRRDNQFQAHQVILLAEREGIELKGRRKPRTVAEDEIETAVSI